MHPLILPLPLLLPHVFFLSPSANLFTPSHSFPTLTLPPSPPHLFSHPFYFSANLFTPFHKLLYLIFQVEGPKGQFQKPGETVSTCSCSTYSMLHPSFFHILCSVFYVLLILLLICDTIFILLTFPFYDLLFSITFVYNTFLPPSLIQIVYLFHPILFYSHNHDFILFY